MENVFIRQANIDDLDTLLEFEQGIVKTERPFDRTLKEGLIHYYDLEQLILSPDAEVVLAGLGNEIIGSGYALIKNAKDYLKHERYAYLGFMYVKPEYRGRAVNQQILNTLKEWASAQNITEIRLEVYSKNLGAIKAYEKGGFQPHMLEMRLEVD